MFTVNSGGVPWSRTLTRPSRISIPSGMVETHMEKGDVTMESRGPNSTTLGHLGGIET